MADDGANSGGRRSVVDGGVSTQCSSSFPRLPLSGPNGSPRLPRTQSTGRTPPKVRQRANQPHGPVSSAAYTLTRSLSLEPSFDRGRSDPRSLHQQGEVWPFRARDGLLRPAPKFAAAFAAFARGLVTRDLPQGRIVIVSAAQRCNFDVPLANAERPSYQRSLLLRRSSAPGTQRSPRPHREEP